MWLTLIFGRYLLELGLWALAAWLIIPYVNWHVAVGLLVMVWANNLRK